MIDAEARLAERLEERAQERERTVLRHRHAVDVVAFQRTESLRLARVELDRQREVTAHAARRAQLDDAIAEIDRQLAELVSGVG